MTPRRPAGGPRRPRLDLRIRITARLLLARGHGGERRVLLHGVAEDLRDRAVMRAETMTLRAQKYEVMYLDE